MATFFDEAYYLKTKLTQLKSVGEKDANGNDYTLKTLQQAINDAGMTPESHYQQFGRAEHLNPNAYFNESEYLQAKLNQLHSLNEKDENGNDFTVETLVKAIEGLGLSVAEHYEQFGSHETDAKGNLINPSNGFDSNAYVAAKLAELVKAEPEQWAGKTAADVVAAIAEAGMSPVTHYEMHGVTEANAFGVALVQTVPVTLRVENDPARATVTGELVPSNYNAPTPPPSAVTAETAAPVTKPADMGGLANTSVSPAVTVPAKPVPVPGDSDYVAPPANIVDTNDNPVVVVPPTSAGGKPQFGVVTDGGTVIGVDNNGNTTGDVIGKVDGDSGTVTPVEPVTPTPDPTPTPTPTPFTVSTNEMTGVVSFTGGNGTIDFTIDNSTATFTSGGTTQTVSEFGNKSINLTSNQTLTADVATLTRGESEDVSVTGDGTVSVQIKESYTENSKLSLPNISANIALDASGAGEGMTVEAVKWIKNSNMWEDTAGFQDGKVVSVTGSAYDDVIKLDLDDIGELTKADTSNYNITFTANTALKLDGGEGQDTLDITWFAKSAQSGQEPSETLQLLNSNNFFSHVTNFENIVLNKGNGSTSLNINASSLDGQQGEAGTLTLMTSANITGITDKLTISFTEGKLTSLADLNVTAASGNDTLNLKIMDSGAGQNGFVNLTATDFTTINFLGSSKDITKGTSTTKSVALGTTDQVSLFTESGATYIVATGNNASVHTDDWVVQLTGVTTENLTVSGGTVTVDLSTTTTA